MKHVRRSHGVHANPFTLFPRIIVSMAWLPGQRAQRQLRDAFTQDRPDASPSTSSSSTRLTTSPRAARSAPTRSDRSDAATPSIRSGPVRFASIAERAEHRLFLSATPHNGYTESFTALLEMIDPQRFVRGNKIDRAGAARRSRSVGSSVTSRRRRASSTRQVSQLSYTPTADESEAYDRLLAFTQRRDRAVAARRRAAGRPGTWRPCC